MSFNLFKFRSTLVQPVYDDFFWGNDYDIEPYDTLYNRYKDVPLLYDVKEVYDPYLEIRSPVLRRFKYFGDEIEVKVVSKDHINDALNILNDDELVEATTRDSLDTNCIEKYTSNWIGLMEEGNSICLFNKSRNILLGVLLAKMHDPGPRFHFGKEDRLFIRELRRLGANKRILKAMVHYFGNFKTRFLLAHQISLERKSLKKEELAHAMVQGLYDWCSVKKDPLLIVPAFRALQWEKCLEMGFKVMRLPSQFTWSGEYEMYEPYSCAPPVFYLKCFENYEKDIWKYYTIY